MRLELANRSIYNCLELAAAKHEFIYTNPYQRKVGKSKALIEFARDNGYVVLVSKGAMAEFLVNQFGYKNISSIRSRLLRLNGSDKIFVFDECCDLKDVEELKNLGFRIITGFVVEW